MAALIALVDMAAERRDAAAFDRGHHLTLRVGQGGTMIAAIGHAMAAGHIRHRQLGPGHWPKPQQQAGGGGFVATAGGCCRV
jgi:hypothetical protein